MREKQQSNKSPEEQETPELRNEDLPNAIPEVSSTLKKFWPYYLEKSTDTNKNSASSVLTDILDNDSLIEKVPLYLRNSSFVCSGI